jgi:hypothetical protein
MKFTNGDFTRSIVLRDLDPDLDRYLREFVSALVQRHGNLRQGWSAMCRAGGGHLHETGLANVCAGMGIDATGAAMLFKVLDPTQRRYLTEYDKLDFLDIWNPGNVSGPAHEAAALAIAKQQSEAQQSLSSLTARLTSSMGADNDSNLQKLGHFEFNITLTKEEYSEYLRRKRTARISAGLKSGGVPQHAVGVQRRKKSPPGGHKPRPPSAPTVRGRSEPPRSKTPPRSQSKPEDMSTWHSMAPASRRTYGPSGPLPRKDRAPTMGALLSTPVMAGM